MSFYTRTNDENEEKHEITVLPVSSRRTFPPAPFPHKYVHCVVDDLYYLVQSVHALRADGHDAADIHVMMCWDYVAAVEHRGRRRGRFAKILARFLSLLDDDSGDIYLREAQRGNHVLMVRLSRYNQMMRVRDMLVLHNGRFIRYVDTWTVSYLWPALIE